MCKFMPMAEVFLGMISFHELFIVDECLFSLSCLNMLVVKFTLSSLCKSIFNFRFKVTCLECLFVGILYKGLKEQEIKDFAYYLLFVGVQLLLLLMCRYVSTRCCIYLRIIKVFNILCLPRVIKLLLIHELTIEHSYVFSILGSVSHFQHQFIQSTNSPVKAFLQPIILIILIGSFSLTWLIGSFSLTWRVTSWRVTSQIIQLLF